MKKLFVLFALLAGIAVMTGCKKDQDVVTLKAVIDQETKAFFGDGHDHLPYWDDADRVYIAGPGITPNSYSLNIQNTTFATISDVPACSVYCAIFPATAVHTMGTPNAAETKATIKFPSEQKYILDGDHQRLEMPMGAVATPTSTGTTTLFFKNLCSILRVNVKNLLPISTAIDVRRITLNAYGAYITGKADVTLSENGVPTVAMDELDHEHNNVLSFYAPGYASMAHLNYNADQSFDIVVPPFDATYLILEVEVYDPNNNGSILGYSSHVIGTPNSTEATVHLVRNKIIPINLEIKGTNLLQPSYAYLEPGPAFNEHMHDLIDPLIGTSGVIRNISFNRSSLPNPLPAGAIEVQDDNSPYKIYAYIVDNDVIINSDAPIIYANSNCSHMYEGLTTLTSVHWNNDPTEGEGGLQTEDVTDMSYMFAGCTNLQTFSGLEHCNTTNVTTMAHMFEGCNMNGDDLSYALANFNTHNLENMSYMFRRCGVLSTIDLSSFTTERVTDMSYLFSGCEKLTRINTNTSGFVISSNTNIDSICHRVDYYNLPLNEWNPSRDPCYITCSDGVWNTLKGQANGSNPDPTTGVNLTVIYRGPAPDPNNK
jgi:surface protein